MGAQHEFFLEEFHLYDHDLSIHAMTIRHNNEIILSFKSKDGDTPSVTFEGGSITIKDLNQDDFRDLPVILKCGAIDYEIGYISRVRVGREEIYGDLILNLNGSLKLESIHNEENKIIGTKPVRYEFVRQ